MTSPCRLLAALSTILMVSLAAPLAGSEHGTQAPEGWTALSPRPEIRPIFSFDPAQGRTFTITGGPSIGEHGWWQKAFPVIGGKYYRFEGARRTEHVAVPRRSAPVRMVWQDASGKPVLANVPIGREHEPGPVPLAEPEHPLDGPTDAEGRTRVAGTYRAPTGATRA